MVEKKNNWYLIGKRIRSEGKALRSNEIVNYFDKDHPLNLEKYLNMEHKTFHRQTVKYLIKRGVEVGRLKRNPKNVKQEGYNQHNVEYEDINIFEIEDNLVRHLQNKLSKYDNQINRTIKSFSLDAEKKSKIFYNLQKKLLFLESNTITGKSKFGNGRCSELLEQIKNKKSDLEKRRKQNEELNDRMNDFQLEEILLGDEEIEKMLKEE